MSFKSKLNNFMNGELSRRDELQELIHMALDHLADKNDPVYLTMLLTRSVAVKSLPTVTIKDYIKANAPVKYAKNKAGDHVFMQDKTSESVLTVRPAETWYDWKKAKHNQVRETDYSKRLTTDAKKLIENGKKNEIVSSLLAAGLTTNDILNMLDSLDNLGLKAA